MEERLKRIREELAGLQDHPWAGNYSCWGGSEAISLSVAPRSGAVYRRISDVGLLDWNHGDVVASGNELCIALKVDPALHRSVTDFISARPFLSKEWIVVPWGDQRFLVPSCRMVPFLNAVNKGEYPDYPRKNAGGFYGDAPPPGRPEVPSEYRPFLLTQPLEGQLLRVTPPEVLRTWRDADETVHLLRIMAVVDLGTDDGLLPGMALHPVGEAHGVGEVVDARADAASVEFRFPDYDLARDCPQAGWRVSTRSGR